MPSKQQIAAPPVDPGSIPDPNAAPWDEKLKLTESNLKQWLLGEFNKQRGALEEVKKRMREEGISDQLIAHSIRYETSSEEHVRKETLKLVINPKTGKFWDITTLQNAGKLSNAEIQGIRAEHGRDPPYYYVTGIRRVLDDLQNPPREYLTYSIIFEGICVGKREGVINPEANMKINESTTIGYHVVPRITWETIKDSDGEEKRVATFDSLRTPIIDNANTRVYEIEWDKKIVEALLKYTKNGAVLPGLGITRLSDNKHYAASSLEEFMTDDLPGLIKSRETPKPTYTFNIAPERLAKYLQMEEAAKEEHQYQ